MQNSDLQINHRLFVVWLDFGRMNNDRFFHSICLDTKTRQLEQFEPTKTPFYSWRNWDEYRNYGLEGGIIYLSNSKRRHPSFNPDILGTSVS